MLLLLVVVVAVVVVVVSTFNLGLLLASTSAV